MKMRDIVGTPENMAHFFLKQARLYRLMGERVWMVQKQEQAAMYIRRALSRVLPWYYHLSPEAMQYIVRTKVRRKGSRRIQHALAFGADAEQIQRLLEKYHV